MDVIESGSRTREITMPFQSKTDQLIAWIRERIAGGDWPPGQRLPSRKDLIAEHGVSLTVVRHAQERLRATGELESVPGVGWFVSER